MKNFLLVLGLLIAATTTLLAETFTLTPQTSEIAPQFIDQINGTGARIGLSGSGGYGRNGFYAFPIPKIAFGDTITGASFSSYLSSLSGTGFTFNADLYSLGVSGSSTALISDYFNGAYGTDPQATALQQHFLVPTSTIGTISSNSTGGSAIASDLNTYLSAGATAGSYYLMRMSPDFTGAPWNAFLGYNVSLTGDANSAHWPSLTVTTSKAPQLGRVLIEYWTGITGTAVSNLTGSSNYPNKPAAREFATVMEIPSNMDTNSGDRLRGYFYPPTTGNYTFAIASDDNSSLLFSADGNPAHATQIASVALETGYQQWNKYPSQTSSAIALTAGQVCYIESQHKQGSGYSYLSIGYMPPGATSIALMPTDHVAPYDAGTNYTSGAISWLVTQAHPRLMLSAPAIARLKTAIAVSGSVQANWWASIQTQANTILTQSVIAPPAGTQYIISARTLQDRVYYLGLDYLLNTNATIQNNCLTKIYTELQSAANWGQGGPGPNGLDAKYGPWGTWSFLDVPEISHAFAIAYDWCYNGWTPTQKTFILNTVVANAFTPAIASYAPPTQDFLNGVGNWTIVCDSGLTISALAVLGDETTSPKAPTILDDLIPTLYNSPAMAEFSPDGSWPEGECYWNFSTRYLSTLFASLETSCATCFNFDKLNGLSSMGSFGLYEDGPLNLTFNFSDESFDYFLADQGNSRALQYFGLKYNQPVYSWRQQQTISSYSPLYVWEQPANQQWAPGLTSVMPYPTDLLWYDPRGATASPSNLNLPASTYFRNAGIILLRSAWNDSNALFAGLKAGYNAGALPDGSGHEQLEIGSFVFDALGVRWAIDMGRDNYSKPYFNITPSNTTANRWQYYRCRAEGNNTLVIKPSLDGGQALNANATVTNFKSATNPTNVQQGIIDMTSAYSHDTFGNATVVTSAKRGMRFVPATNGKMVAQIQDEITTTSSSGPVEMDWFMHTATGITYPSANSVLLTSGSTYLLMTIRSPSGAVFTNPSPSAVPLSTSPDYTGYPNSTLPAGAVGGESPNTGVKKLQIKYMIPTGTQTTTLEVDMCPYTGSTAPVAPTAPALSGW